LREIAIRQQRKVTVDDLERIGAMRRVCGQALELQRQAFGAIARTDAGGLEALNELERNRKLLRLQLELGGKKLADFGERRREIAVLIEGVDQRGDDLAIAHGKTEQ